MHLLLGNTLVALRLALVSADLLVLPLALLHEFLKGSVVVLGDRLGGHLDSAVSVGTFDLCSDLLNRCLQHLDTEVFVQTLTSQHVERGSHQSDLDLVLGGVVRLGGPESILDGVDTIVSEASDLNIGTDLSRVGSELLADVLLELLLHGFAWEFDLVPDLRVPRAMKSGYGRCK